jgi:hypothetical protein
MKCKTMRSPLFAALAAIALDNVVGFQIRLL